MEEGREGNCRGGGEIMHLRGSGLVGIGGIRGERGMGEGD